MPPNWQTLCIIQIVKLYALFQSNATKGIIFNVVTKNNITERSGGFNPWPPPCFLAFLPCTTVLSHGREWRNILISLHEYHATKWACGLMARDPKTTILDKKNTVFCSTVIELGCRVLQVSIGTFPETKYIAFSTFVFFCRLVVSNCMPEETSSEQGRVYTQFSWFFERKAVVQSLSMSEWQNSAFFIEYIFL